MWNFGFLYVGLYCRDFVVEFIVNKADFVFILGASVSARAIHRSPKINTKSALFTINPASFLQESNLVE